MVVAGASSYVIAIQLNFGDDITRNWWRAGIFALGGPLLFALTARFANLVSWKKVEAAKAATIIVLIVALFVGAGVKFFMEVDELLSKVNNSGR